MTHRIFTSSSIKGLAPCLLRLSSFPHIARTRGLEMFLYTLTIILILFGESLEGVFKDSIKVVGFKLLGNYCKFKTEISIHKSTN